MMEINSVVLYSIANLIGAFIFILAKFRASSLLITDGYEKHSETLLANIVVVIALTLRVIYYIGQIVGILSPAFGANGLIRAPTLFLFLALAYLEVDLVKLRIAFYDYFKRY